MEREELLNEIREAEGRRISANPLANLIQEWLTCQDAQNASQTLTRALSAHGQGDPVWPGPGIWPLPPA